MSQRLKRVLVVYSTVSGCTATIARRIGVDLIAYGGRPFVRSVEEVGRLAGKYDAVVFGSGVRMGKWHREAREWIQNNLDELADLPVALFSVGLRGVSSDGHVDPSAAQGDLERAMSAAGVTHTVGSVVLPGWKRSEGFSAMERVALRVYPLEDGDYRNWDMVDRWVCSVGPVLMGRDAPRAR